MEDEAAAAAGAVEDDAELDGEDGEEGAGVDGEGDDDEGEDGIGAWVKEGREATYPEVSLSSILPGVQD